MSIYDYKASKVLGDMPFSVLIMTAMRKAKGLDESKLQSIFPQVWAELHKRDNTPDGLLANERINKDELLRL